MAPGETPGGHCAVGDGREPAWEAVSVPLRGRPAARIQTFTWTPPDSVVARAVVVIAHGAGEHVRRYDRLARALAETGCVVVGFDNLGHGQTANPELGGAGLAELGPGGNRSALDVLVAMLERARGTHRGLPLVLLGHSWGALLGQQALARRSDLVDAVVLSGATLAVPGFLNPGDLDAPWRPDESGLQWLSRDPAVREAFAADPACFDIAERPVWSPLQSLQLLHLPPSAASGHVDDVPVLILAGADDTIGYGARGPRMLARAYRRRTKLSDVTLEVFPAARHEVYNETNRDEVIARLVDWLEARIGRARAPRRGRHAGPDATE